MNALPIVLVMTAGVAVGVYLGWLFLRRERSKPTVIGAHVILAVIGLEGVAMLIKGTPDGADPATGQLVRAAGLFLVLAVMTGFATPMISKKRPRKVGMAAIGVHAAVAATGYVLLVAWAMQA
jgi:drug/metabolite transporter superfamily protein YnfA